MSGPTLHELVRYAALALLGGLLLLASIGWRQVQSARRTPYYLLRREQMIGGWRFVAAGLALGAAGLAVLLLGVPAVERAFPPTPTVTATATITLTPTITQTPTITPTPTISPIPSDTPTPTVTPTPLLPEAITIPRLATVTPNPEAAFSPIVFSARLVYPPGEGQTVFRNPRGHLYGIFQYNNLDPGVAWTALWYQDGALICVETMLWEGPTGGYGFTDCEQETWRAGEVEVQLFVGETFKRGARFTIEIDATATPTP